MKKCFGLVLGLGLLASMGSLQASVATCTDTTLSALIALNGSGGCEIGDKIFSAFSYTPLSGAPASTAVSAGLDADTVNNIYGWTFAVPSSSFLGNFSLGFTVTVDTTVCKACLITSVTEQILGSTAPGGGQTQAASVAESAGGSPILVNNLSNGGLTNGDSFAGVAAITKTATISGVSASEGLVSFESLVRQTSVPEPMTLSLMGAGLLGLGLLRKRIGRS